MTYRVFRHLAIERARPVPALAELAPVEKLVGKLPPLVRELLLAAQGGSIDYVCQVRNQPMVFAQFFALAELPGEIASCRDTLGAPRRALPVARDGGDSILFVLLDSGKVVAHLRGRPAWTGRGRSAGPVAVARSLDAYLHGLAIDPEQVISGLTRYARTKEHVDATVEYLNIGLPAWVDDPRLTSAVARARKRVAA